MSMDFVTTAISIIGGLLTAAASYLFTKQKEREADWRKEKISYYKSFVESLSGIVEGDSTQEGHRIYAKTSNDLMLFASQPVIEALNEFRNENRVSNSNRTQEQHDKLLALLFLEIRKDIGISPRDNPNTFKPRLWASSAGRNEP